VVNKVVSELGLRKFETNVDITSEPFLNIEIFRQINRSALVIVDVTGLRPNCFMEMGYAYGSGKRVILTAREDTELPFDSASLPCFFWSKTSNPRDLTKSFDGFIKKNVDRGPLVGVQTIQTTPNHSQVPISINQ
jgi:hypothetical protein